MKELSIEEKAKAYDEAIKVAEKYHNGTLKDVMETIFPELAESEDERMRKELICFLETEIPQCNARDKYIAWLEKQGEQKHETPIPRFNIGDWVIDEQDIVHQIANVIENVTYHTYGYDIVGGGYFNDNTEGVRLWTIQDAKDGDVLSDGTTIFIFKDLLSDGSVMSYCDYDTDSGESDAFCPLSVNLMCSKITPSTKEQRDQLEKAMTDAGYTFDFDKKELKKIMQEDSPSLTKENSTPLSGGGKGDLVQEDPVSDDLSAEIDYLSKRYPEVSFAKLSRIAVHIAKWQKDDTIRKVAKWLYANFYISKEYVSETSILPIPKYAHNATMAQFISEFIKHMKKG